jgi:DNA-binding transcriptional LysR family regulator
VNQERTVAPKGTIDLNDIRVFARVVEARSFSLAAKQLGLPKSAVSRRVARLEDALGAQLLQRTTRRLHLTDAGARYHQQAMHALAALSDAADDLGVMQQEPRGTVRLTAPLNLVLQDLARPIAEFNRLYPRVTVELVLTSRFVDLVAEGFDFALRAGILQDSSLVAKKIFSSSLVLMAAESYVQRRGAPNTPEELGNHDCVLYKAEAGRNRWVLHGPIGERTLTVTGTVSADDLGVVVALVHEGAGIGLVPAERSQVAGAAGKVVRVLPGWHGPPGGLYIVYPPAPHVPQRVRLLQDHLYESLRSTMKSELAASEPSRRSARERRHRS